jgi:hypothetical protein
MLIGSLLELSRSCLGAMHASSDNRLALTGVAMYNAV